LYKSKRLLTAALCIFWFSSHSLFADIEHDSDSHNELTDWPVYGGEPGGSRFSSLQQINKDNVHRLTKQWQYHTHDFPGDKPHVKNSSFQATPILFQDTLYFCSGLSRAFALDAATGEEKWIYDAAPDLNKVWNRTCRGVALWDNSDNNSEEVCNSRIFMGTLDGRLLALDAVTGKPCTDFGHNGSVNLHEGLGDVSPGELYMTSPPTVINDIVLHGALVMDNQRADSPGGVIRAFDVRSGKVRWAFDPVPPGSPSPQQLGAPPEQKYHRGTPNAWSIFSTDPERNLIFIPFGGAGPDYVGGHRNQHGFDLDFYANSTVALNAHDGSVAWHFQAVHHDLWDYDVASQPILIDVDKDGTKLPAVVQATKIGHLFILHRETGIPIYPVEERPVPQTSLPDEYTSPTQPFPTFPKPLHPAGLTEDDLWGFTFIDRKDCQERFRASHNEGLFTPPALGPVIQFPGVAGGQNWGSLTYDPVNKLLVMPQNYVVSLNSLVKREEKPDIQRGNYFLGYSANEGTPYVVKHDMLLSNFGTPCIKPPWGTLLAVSLESGEKVWEVPFGTTRDMVPGLSVLPFGLNLGLPSAGGPISTASGLVFIGASMDNYMRAYNTVNGEELWRTRLPAGGQATPMTYRLSNGKQYVVIAAGGHASMRTKLGDSLIAFALPD